MQIQLLDGAYEARSVIAANQRCINLYPEVNQLSPAAPIPQPITPAIVTHYPTPGLQLLATVGTGPIRGIYVASNGATYVASGSFLYSLDVNFTPNELGYIGSLTTPVSMIDNGATLVVVDGSPFGFQVDLATNALSQISDPAFYGADRADYIDTYLVFNKPDSSFFYTTLSNQVVPFDATYIAGKTGFVDRIVSVVMVHNELWLIGEQTSEVWYNAGGSTFPFARVQGSFIQMGCAAKYSIASAENAVFWLSQNKQGERMVMAGSAYQAQRISTHAIEYALAGYSDVSDAIGMIYQQQGHTFYVLTFPTADKTWVFDLSTQLWHERAWSDDSGQLHRIRANCMAHANGQVLAGDWQNGDLYAVSEDIYTDNGQPIVRIRSFPTFQNELQRVMYQGFMADMEVGSATFNADTAANQAALLVWLRWSDDGGKSWSEPVYRSLGAIGETLTSLKWRRLGVGRRRVFELQWSAAVHTALNGAYIDVTPTVS